VLLASTSLGASSVSTLGRVVIPLSLPGIVAGLQLVMAVVLSDFVLPTLLGTTRFRMLAPAIYQEAIANIRWANSAAMAILMLVLVILILLSMNLMLRRAAPWAKSF
jgi:putative spermidine/putrescine transport system permease protein